PASLPGSHLLRAAHGRVGRRQDRLRALRPRMKYLTYSGNNLVQAELPDGATIYYPPASLPGIARPDIPAAVRHAFENPLGMPPLRELVGPRSRILIAFDDNCQPFPPMRQPDIRQIVIGTLLELLDSYGVQRRNVQLRCAVAL